MQPSLPGSQTGSSGPATPEEREPLTGGDGAGAQSAGADMAHPGNVQSQLTAHQEAMRAQQQPQGAAQPDEYSDQQQAQQASGTCKQT